MLTQGKVALCQAIQIRHEIGNDKKPLYSAPLLKPLFVIFCGVGVRGLFFATNEHKRTQRDMHVFVRTKHLGGRSVLAFKDFYTEKRRKKGPSPKHPPIKKDPQGSF